MIFNPDNKVTGILSGIVDVAEVFLLTLLCCTPVFTIGASVVAMHKTMTDIILKKSSSIHRTFFVSFKENFRLGTSVWFFALIFAALLFVNVNICWGYTGQQQSFAQLLKGAVIVFICAWFIVFTYAFTFIALFNVTFKQTIKNAVFIGIGKFGLSLIILMLKAISIFALWFLWIYAIPVVCVCLYFENRILIYAMMDGDAFKRETIKEDREVYYE